MTHILFMWVRSDTNLIREEEKQAGNKSGNIYQSEAINKYRISNFIRFMISILSECKIKLLFCCSEMFLLEI